MSVVPGVRLFSFDYPPNHGGISRLCAEIVAGYDRRGVDVRVLSQAASAEAGSRIPEVPAIRVTSRRPWREWAAWFRLYRNSRSTTPVICSIWYPEGLLAMLAGVRPRVILAHGNELMPTRSRWRRGLWRFLQSRVLTSADLVVGDSEYSCQLARSTAKSCKAVAVPLAVDHHRFSTGDRELARAKFGLSPDQRVLCTVARIQAYKGYDVVFRALAALPPAVREQFVYLIAGRGPDVVSLQALANDLGIESSLRWLGFVPEEDLPGLYQASDLFVLCTRETEQQEVEGFGLAFLEAQACGIPVVGTRSGGIPDAIREGEGGWLIDPEDSETLAGILQQLHETPDLFLGAGQAARARVERECTWDHYFERFEAALKREGISL